MGKYFVFGNKKEVEKEKLIEIDKERQELSLQTEKRHRETELQVFLDYEDNLIHANGRIVIKVDMLKKNYHTFENGQQIRLERQYNNFNRRQTEPVNAVVISGDGMNNGDEILISHNALHDINRIFDYKNGIHIGYFSIPTDDCFAWRTKGGEWQPAKNFQFGLRVYKPYSGLVSGIEPELIKNTLYITTGDLKGMVCHTLQAADYEIVFQGDDGKEKSLIRIRHSDTEEIEREEIVAIDHNLTELVKANKIIVK